MKESNFFDEKCRKTWKRLKNIQKLNLPKKSNDLLKKENSLFWDDKRF